MAGAPKFDTLSLAGSPFGSGVTSVPFGAEVKGDPGEVRVEAAHLVDPAGRGILCVSETRRPNKNGAKGSTQQIPDLKRKGLRG